MRKTIKGLFCMMLVLVMALSFVACENSDENVQNMDGLEGAKKTTEKMLTALCKLDMATVKECTSAEFFEEEFSQMGDVSIEELMAEELPEGVDVQPMVDAFEGVMDAAIDFEIVSAEEKDDGAVVKVKLLTKNPENVSEEQLYEALSGMEEPETEEEAAEAMAYMFEEMTALIQDMEYSESKESDVVLKKQDNKWVIVEFGEGFEEAVTNNISTMLSDM